MHHHNNSNYRHHHLLLLIFEVRGSVGIQMKYKITNPSSSFSLCMPPTKGPGASHGSKQKETQRDPVRAREQLQQPPTLHELTSSCTGTAAPSEDVRDPMWLIDSVHVDPLSQDT
ncbi:hypothetical protein F2P81_013411 [Scophthalmus maximus]|uniref:Uncharacterized protein n=1 Tax=Scophthalmus maximus TaxID=52904 RepID=A0A6A4SLC2_SCOMX|nr:hypothetical protein F2P81_013411 [Scophthalmus maximus]